ncbi:MAG: hypothetical protein WDZ79_03115 [Candidatus Paceibacterota bacterium]
MFSFFSKTDKKTHLLIECGSASVACAFLVTDADRKPKLVYQKRVSLDTQETEDHRATLATLTKILSKLLREARSKGHAKLENIDAPKRVSDITVTFTAPWYSTSTTRVNQQYEEERTITESYLTGLTTQAEERFYKEAAELFSAEFREAEPVIIENTILQTKLNGYATDNPTDREAFSFDAQLYTSAVPKPVFDGVESAIGEVFSIAHITYHTLPLVSFIALSDLFSSISNALLIDISGERTSLVTVHEGAIRNVSSFAGGTHHFIRRIAEKLNVGTGAAASALAMHDLSKLDPASHDSISNLALEHTNEWFNRYQEQVEKIKKDHPVSLRVVVIATGGMTEYFFTALKKHSEENTKEGVHLLQLTNEHLAKRLRFPESPPPDPFIALEAIVLADNEL